MTNRLSDEEINYRHNKEKNLVNIFKSFEKPIDFIWIDKNSRRRLVFQVDNNHNFGFFQEKSHKLNIVDNCEIAEKSINDLLPSLRKFLKNISTKLLKQIVVTNFDNGLDLVFRYIESPSSQDEKQLIDFAKSQNLVLSLQINSSIFPIYLPRKNQIYCGDYKLIVDSDIFIQATKKGLENIVNILRKTLDDNQAKKIAELYCGCGIYSFTLLDLNRQFECFEGSESMIKIIKNNVKNFNINQKITPFVRDLYNNPLSVKELNIFDNVIINPPRNGAEPQIANIAKSQVKYVQYVSCNPISLVRDAKILVDEKYNISNITAIDQFYSTMHHEIIISFEKI